MMNKKNKISSNIKFLRNMNGISQKDLSKILNITPQTLWNYENNVSQPTLDVFLKIADKFNISLDLFVNNDLNINYGNIIGLKDEYRNTVANNIKQARENANITQFQLAKLIKKSTQMIKKYENGETVPNGKRLEEIAQALNCNVSDLFKSVSSSVELLNVSDDTSITDDLNQLNIQMKKIDFKHGSIAIEKIADKINKITIEKNAYKTKLERIKSMVE